MRQVRASAPVRVGRVVLRIVERVEVRAGARLAWAEVEPLALLVERDGRREARDLDGAPLDWAEVESWLSEGQEIVK